MRWAENEEAGWCEKHVEAYVNIAGPVLGVPKAVTACLSGHFLFSHMFAQVSNVCDSGQCIKSCVAKRNTENALKNMPHCLLNALK